MINSPSLCFFDNTCHISILRTIICTVVLVILKHVDTLSFAFTSFLQCVCIVQTISPKFKDVTQVCLKALSSITQEKPNEIGLSLPKEKQLRKKSKKIDAQLILLCIKVRVVTSFMVRFVLSNHVTTNAKIMSMKVFPAIK